MKTLKAACVPRPSVFDRNKLDTVYNIDDLSSLDPEAFFSENYVTEGMCLLLTEAFKRLEGKSSNVSGTFLLSQSMGGGKTHNLLALGLLAKFPDMREKVMGDFYTPAPLGSVRVITFSGRNTNTPYGIWGEIAEQLNKREIFSDFYSPLKPPSDGKWVELLSGEPLLIMLDELPPYFEAAQGIQIGRTYLDVITTAAIANLLVAINSGKLPNVCVVITDLSGQAYSSGGAAVSQALQSLSNLEQEVNRSVTRIDPVRINTDEFYQILRKRLFEKLPDDEEIEVVAEGYRVAVDAAKRMDMTTLSPDQVKAAINHAYPFHPAIRDLYARFKENRGFQQTRALIRIMRLVVSDLWNSGKAEKQFLIGAQNYDLHDAVMMSEVRQINSTLEVAIAHDIASEDGSAVAEQIDAGKVSDAQDVARLIFLSALSTAVNPVLGLTRSEIFGYLAAPGREITNLRSAIDQLQQPGGAWYIHATRDGKLFFRNVENLTAKLESYTKNKLREQKEKELRDRLEEMFSPTTKAAYQKLLCLPAVDQVQLLPDQVTLIIFRPSEDSYQALEEFYNAQLYKNRVGLLTGSGKMYETVLQRAAALSAIRSIFGELREGGTRETDPQFIEIQEMQTKLQAQFYQACRETFTLLYYPSKNGLTSVDLDPKYVANEYKGEEQVLNALREAYKYQEDISPDGPFRKMVESKLWPQSQKDVAWSTIKQQAAMNSAWVWHHPQALENLKNQLVSRDVWRENRGFVERGPFPQPPTSVMVQQLYRDNDTGQVTLRIRPLQGDVVYMEKNGNATENSQRLEDFDLKTKALALSFLCVDTKHVHETGPPFTWTNTITIKHRFFQDGNTRRCEMKAIPEGEIRYSIDGSNVAVHGQTYIGPVEVPKATKVILAVASADCIKSDIVTNLVPEQTGGGGGVIVDPDKAVVWKRRFQRESTRETWEFLELANKHGAELGGVRFVTSKDGRWVELTTASDNFHPFEHFYAASNALKEFVPDGALSLDVTSMRFDSGRQLLGMVADLKVELQPDEVSQ